MGGWQKLLEGMDYPEVTFQERNTGRTPRQENLPTTEDLLRPYIQDLQSNRKSRSDASGDLLQDAVDLVGRFDLASPENDGQPFRKLQVLVRAKGEATLNRTSVYRINQALNLILLDILGRGRRKPEVFVVGTSTDFLENGGTCSPEIWDEDWVDYGAPGLMIQDAVPPPPLHRPAMLWEDAEWQMEEETEATDLRATLVRSAPGELMRLEFSRMLRGELLRAIMQSGPATFMRMRGLDVKPVWANGALTLVAGLQPSDVDLSLLREKHVLIHAEDFKAILSALSQLPHVHQPIVSLSLGLREY